MISTRPTSRWNTQKHRADPLPGAAHAGAGLAGHVGVALRQSTARRPRAPRRRRRARHGASRPWPLSRSRRARLPRRRGNKDGADRLSLSARRRRQGPARAASSVVPPASSARRSPSVRRAGYLLRPRPVVGVVVFHPCGSASGLRLARCSVVAATLCCCPELPLFAVLARVDRRPR